MTTTVSQPKPKSLNVTEEFDNLGITRKIRSFLEDTQSRDEVIAGTDEFVIDLLHASVGGREEWLVEVTLPDPLQTTDVLDRHTLTLLLDEDLNKPFPLADKQKLDEKQQEGVRELMEKLRKP
jgi:hypothetical protein